MRIWHCGAATREGYICREEALRQRLLLSSIPRGTNNKTPELRQRKAQERDDIELQSDRNVQEYSNKHAKPKHIVPYVFAD